jgi:hypothetical protein
MRWIRDRIEDRHDGREDDPDRPVQIGTRRRPTDSSPVSPHHSGDAGADGSGLS